MEKVIEAENLTKIYTGEVKTIDDISFDADSGVLVIAIRITRWETLVAVVNLLNLPPLFSSSAVLPISSMPDWLQTFAIINPISKGAHLTRTLVIKGSINLSILGSDVAYLLGFAMILVVIGGVSSLKAPRTE